MDQNILCDNCSIAIENKEEIYCEACLNKIVKTEEIEIEALNKEIEELNNQLSRVQKEVSRMNENRQKMQVEKIQEDKSNLEKEVLQLEDEEQKQKNELSKLKSQIMDLEKNEDNLWEHTNKFTKKLHQLFENNQIADNQLNQLNNELERLSKLDIVNDLFKISVQEEVGCINNLGIGKKGDQPIDWDDINAAAGHLSLLLVYLMKKYSYNMQKIDQIELNGSNTRLITKEFIQDKEQLKPINLFMANKGNFKEEDEFNDAFVLLYVEFGLFCRYLVEGDILSKRKIQLNLPYKMNGQMIADKSINLKLLNNQKYAAWSDAVKKYLTNVKAVIVMNAQFDLSL